MSCAFKSKVARFKMPEPKVPGPGHYKVLNSVKQSGLVVSFTKEKRGIENDTPSSSTNSTPSKKFKVPSLHTSSRKSRRHSMMVKPSSRSSSRGSYRSPSPAEHLRTQVELNTQKEMVERLNKELHGIENERCAERQKITEITKKLHEEMRQAEELMDAKDAHHSTITPWIRYVDKDSNCAYFYNALSGETTWEKPELFVTEKSAVHSYYLSPEKTSMNNITKPLKEELLQEEEGREKEEEEEGENKEGEKEKRSENIIDDGDKEMKSSARNASSNTAQHEEKQQQKEQHRRSITRSLNFKDAFTLDFLIKKVNAFVRWSSARVEALEAEKAEKTGEYKRITQELDNYKNQLQASEALITELHSQVSEQTQEKNDLSDQLRHAGKEIERHKMMLQDAMMKEIKTVESVSTMEATIDDFELRVVCLQSETKKMSKIIGEKETCISSLETKIAELQDAHDALKEEKSLYGKKIQLLNDSLKHTHDLLTDSKQELAAKMLDMDNLYAKMEKADEQSKMLLKEKEIALLQAKKVMENNLKEKEAALLLEKKLTEDLRQQLDTTTGHSMAFESQVENLKVEVEELKISITTSATQLGEKKAHIEEMTKTISNLTTANCTTTSKLEAANIEIREVKQKQLDMIASFKENLCEKEAKIQEMGGKLSELIETNKNAQVEMQQMHTKLEEAKNKEKILKEQVNTLSSEKQNITRNLKNEIEHLRGFATRADKKRLECENLIKLQRHKIEGLVSKVASGIEVIAASEKKVNDLKDIIEVGKKDMATEKAKISKLRSMSAEKSAQIIKLNKDLKEQQHKATLCAQEAAKAKDECSKLRSLANKIKNEQVVIQATKLQQLKEQNAITLEQKEKELISKVTADIEAKFRATNDDQMAKLKKTHKNSIKKMTDKLKILQMQISEKDLTIQHIKDRAAQLSSAKRLAEAKAVGEIGSKMERLRAQQERSKQQHAQMRVKYEKLEKEHRQAVREVADLKNSNQRIKSQSKDRAALLGKLADMLEALKKDHEEEEIIKDSTLDRAKKLLQENIELKLRLDEENRKKPINQFTKQKELVRHLQNENASLVSHRNPKQRIHLHQQIKIENRKLQDELQKQRRIIEKLTLQSRMRGDFSIPEKENQQRPSRRKSLYAPRTVKSSKKGGGAKGGNTAHSSSHMSSLLKKKMMKQKRQSASWTAKDLTDSILQARKANRDVIAANLKI